MPGPFAARSFGGPLKALTLAAAAASLAVFASPAPRAAAQQTPPQPAPQAGAQAQNFAELSRRLMPSVVNISTSQTVIQSGGPAFPQGSILEEFNPSLRGGNARRQNSLGSGFIIDAAGYIVTNNHVIENGDEIDVILSDGTSFPARKVGVDTDVDLALLKIEPRTPLQAVPWANSDQANVGDWVVAIGNPFGLGGTVTVGIISARNRDISSGQFDDFIQTDAAINHGNSGGPLFNLRGEVVGINTAIITGGGETSGSVGVGFSIPANMAKQIVGQLRQYGSSHRGWMGVSVRGVSAEMAESFGLARPEGAIVTQVAPSGPGTAAGLRVGDLITRFNNQPVRSDRDVSRILGAAEVGAEIPIGYIRAGQQGSARVKLVTPPESARTGGNPLVDNNARQPQSRELSNLLGVTFRVLDDQARRRRGVPNSVRGVVVQAIEPGSDALGKVRVGDVVVEVNFQSVTTSEQALRAAEQAKAQRKPVLLMIWGEQEMRFVSVRTR
jgi:serine protease Do